MGLGCSGLVLPLEGTWRLGIS
uniref:Uncharacterized protein n=1 Tax=Anguilla anguilla TaxID=7936 RepID=A0A0E9XXS2_ANGAN